MIPKLPKDSGYDSQLGLLMELAHYKAVCERQAELLEKYREAVDARDLKGCNRDWDQLEREIEESRK